MAHMIGRHCPNGPGGRDCTCCGQPPGRARKTARRAAKHRETARFWRQHHTETTD